MVRIKMLRLLCVLLLLSAGRAFAGKVDTLKLHSDVMNRQSTTEGVGSMMMQ